MHGFQATQSQGPMMGGGSWDAAEAMGQPQGGGLGAHMGGPSPPIPETFQPDAGGGYGLQDGQDYAAHGSEAGKVRAGCTAPPRACARIWDVGLPHRGEGETSWCLVRYLRSYFYPSCLGRARRSARDQRRWMVDTREVRSVHARILCCDNRQGGVWGGRMLEEAGKGGTARLQMVERLQMLRSTLLNSPRGSSNSSC